eukprot:scaffold1722_cov120-Cylindrotheca_fusiformis.AAC.6
MSTLREDELSEKYFYAGCFGLPWLWIVHAMHYHAKTKKANAAAGSLLGSEENQPEQDPARTEVKLAERQWVGRCRSSAIIVTTAWVIWILIVQVFLTDIFPVGLFVRSEEQGAYTGW